MAHLREGKKTSDHEEVKDGSHNSKEENAFEVGQEHLVVEGVGSLQDDWRKENVEKQCWSEGGEAV